DLRLLYDVELDRLRATLHVANRARREVACTIGWAFAADYADLLEANEGKRQQEAPVDTEIVDGAVRLAYRHPQLPFATTIALVAPGALMLSSDSIATRLRLASGETATLELRVDASDPDRPLDEASRAARTRTLESWRTGITAVRTPGNPLVERILE